MRRFLTAWRSLSPSTMVIFLAMAALAFRLIIASPPLAETKDIQDANSRIVSLRASDAVAALRSSDGRPSMLMVYASWCPYCRRLMPEVMGLLKDGQFSHMHVFFVSEDSSYSAMSTYLLRNHYDNLFTPYLVKQSGVNSLAGALKHTGSSFAGYIPYIGFFDGQGKMVAEIKGMVDKERLLQAAQTFN